MESPQFCDTKPGGFDDHVIPRSRGVVREPGRISPVKHPFQLSAPSHYDLSLDRSRLTFSPTNRVRPCRDPPRRIIGEIWAAEMRARMHEGR
jgi:hypothetical protein